MPVVNVVVSPSGIGDPNPAESSISRVWVTGMDGQEVSQIAAGSQFKIKVSFVAKNTSGTMWSVCTTCYCVENQALSRYNVIDSAVTPIGQTVTRTSHDANRDNPFTGTSPDFPVMPSGVSSLTFRIKLWGNNAGINPAFPAVSDW
jgi:hypothetical protein